MVKDKIVYKVILAFATLSFVIAAFLYFTGKMNVAGPYLIMGFVGMALAARGSSGFKGFSYSLFIIAAVTISMYYPEYFLGVGNFQYNKLIVPLLQIIMFGMGSQMSLQDFTGVIKMPKGVLVGIIGQYTIMPVMGITLATLFNFPPEIAAGIVLVGTSPSGMASNVMSFIAKANLALSITLTSITTLLSPLLTPLLMKLLAGQFIEIDFWNMMLGIFDMVILPICAGFIFNLFSNGYKTSKNAAIQLASYLFILVLKNILAFLTSEIALSMLLSNLLFDVVVFGLFPIFGAYLFNYLAKGDKKVMDKLLSFISMLGIVIIITIITAAGRDSLLEVGLLLILACFLHNVFGYALGYTFGKLLRMNEQDCRTIALEVGMQNGGLASGLALQMGKVATVGLAPAIFGPLMNITGSSLASWWRGRPVTNSKNEF